MPFFSGEGGGFLGCQARQRKLEAETRRQNREGFLQLLQHADFADLPVARTNWICAHIKDLSRAEGDGT